MSDEMRDKASLTAPRSKELEVDKEPPGRTEEVFHRSRRNGNAIRVPMLPSKSTAQSSYGLSRISTNDTTLCTSQLAVTEFALYWTKKSDTEATDREGE
ncbi:Ff.00g100610.m01.CDS01 [Fusarium sp. VM40]|nr:Ff.00g100610.m01.CDS01 [Fusarium sp. VM40]